MYHSLPGRKKGDRSCTLMLIKGDSDFVVKDHHREAWPWRAHKDWVRGACGLPEWRPWGRDPETIRRKQIRQNAKRRLERALMRKTPLRVSRPWEVEGISRTTWYARGGRAGQVPPTPTKFPRGHPLTEDQRTRTSEPGNLNKGRHESHRARNLTKRERRPLLHHRNDGPITAMAGRVVAVELWRIKPRRLPPSRKRALLQLRSGKSGSAMPSV